MELSWQDILSTLVPFLSAQYFLMIFVYLSLVRRRIGRAYPFYACFLVSITIFLGGTIGPLLPFKISLECYLYVRFAFLYAMGIPSLFIAATLQMGRPISRKGCMLAYALGLFWGGLYIVLRDCSTYMVLGQWLGYEVWQIKHKLGIQLKHVHLVQMIGAVLFVVLPCLYFLFRRARGTKPVLFLIGFMLFGLCLAVGTALEQWWVFYTGSLFSALLWGGAVFLDLQGMQSKVDNLAPLIGEELMQSISSRFADTTRLQELFAATEMVGVANRFLVIKPDLSEDDAERPEADFGLVKALLDGMLRDFLGGGQYLRLPSGGLHIGLCIHQEDGVEDETIVHLAESIREYIENHSRSTICVGIGGCYGDLLDLRHSYEEAFVAVQHATRTGRNMVVKHLDIRSAQLSGGYPFRERETLVQVMRTNSAGVIEESVNKLMIALDTYCMGNLTACKLRMHEILFILTDTAIADGVETGELETWSKQIDERIDRCSMLAEISVILCEATDHLMTMITAIPEGTVVDVVERAKAFMNERFHDDIGVDDIAKSLNVSRSYLLGMFKKSNSQTINHYLTDLRIEQAKILLLSKSVTEVAFEVGFNTSNYFSTVFKKKTGMTPKQYQQQAR